MGPKHYFGLFLLLILVSIPLFVHLGAAPIQYWDESRISARSLEMMITGNWLVVTFDLKPDLLSVKPPLVAWLQLMSLKIFGVSEWSVRLPAALAALSTVILFYWFIVVKTAKPWLGVLFCLFLVTTSGVVCLHGCRTGDLDTLLMLNTSAYCICFFLYINEGKSTFLLATFIFVALAVLTKGVQGLLFAPALVIYTLISRKTLSVLRTPCFYLGLIILFTVSGGYYIMRERAGEGYLHAVSINELGGRFGKVLEGNSGPPWYYLHWVKSNSMGNWWMFIVPGIAMGLVSSSVILRKMTVYFCILTVTYLLVISCAATKLWWYAMPLYPFLAFFVAVFFMGFLEILLLEGNWQLFKSSYKMPKIVPNVLPIVFLMLIFFKPYKLAVRSAINAVDEYGINPVAYRDMARYLQMALHHKTKTAIVGSVAFDCGAESLVWYSDALKITHIPIKCISGHEPGNASKVIAYLPETRRLLEAHYQVSTIDSLGSVRVYHIDGLRKDSLESFK